MKIAIVSLNLEWQSGGSRQILELARGLKNHEVVIYAPKKNEGAFSSLQDGLKVCRVEVEQPDWSNPKGLLAKVFYKIKQYRVQKAACKQIAEQMDADFDVINCHDYSYPVQYFYKKRNPKVRTVFTMCEPPYSYRPKKNPLMDFASRVYNFLLDRLERKYLVADVTAVVAPYEKEWIEKRRIFSASLSSSIITIPPSPQVIVLLA